MSFGVQSFHARHLLRLGRIHDAEQAKDAIRLARAAGFENVSLDLIFALPEQTVAEWETDLAAAIALGPDHISAYNLTYEDGTPFETMRRRGRGRDRTGNHGRPHVNRHPSRLVRACYRGATRR